MDDGDAQSTRMETLQAWEYSHGGGAVWRCLEMDGGWAGLLHTVSASRGSLIQISLSIANLSLMTKALVTF